MKRDIEQVPSSIAFFEIEDAIEILCSSNAHSPAFIALLLQLSKRVRRKVWHFLTDHNKCTPLWHKDFCAALWLFREKRPNVSVSYCNMHPVFVVPVPNSYKENWHKEERYHIGKVLIDRRRKVSADMMIGGFYTYIMDTELRFPGWEMSHDVPLSSVFEWYFVASALAICIDRMVLHNALVRWKDAPIVPNDKTLYIG